MKNRRFLIRNKTKHDNLENLTRIDSGHTVECFEVGKMESYVHMSIGKLLMFESIKYVGEEESCYVKEAVLHLCDALDSKSLPKEDKEEIKMLIKGNLHRCSEAFQEEFNGAFSTSTETQPEMPVQPPRSVSPVQLPKSVSPSDHNEKLQKSIEGLVDQCIVTNHKETKWDDVILSSELKV